MLKTDDGDLVRQALAGERQAFAALVDRYRDMLCGLAYWHLGSFEDAQDVAQEAFVYAYLHLRELREPARFAAWLRRIALSHCVDRLRRRDNGHLSLDQIAEHAGADEQVAAAGRRPADDPMERLATRMVVREALGRLSAKARVAVTLFYLGGYSHAEIARFLEVPLNTIRSRLRHAKRQLREEMIPMISDVLNEGKPDPQFTRRVVEEAIRRAEKASRSHAMGNALRCYEEALTALDRLEPDEEQRRLKMETLHGMGAAARFPRGMGEAIRLWEQSLAIARELDDRMRQADYLLRIAGHTDPRDLAEAYRRQALEIYRELGDSAGQGECLFWFCRRSLGEGEAISARSYCEQALPFLEAAGDLRLAAVCRAILRLLQEVGEAEFPALLTWNVSCDVLEQKAGTVCFGPHSDFRRLIGSEAVPPGLALLRARSLFAHLAPLGRLLDAAVPLGGGWSGDSWSYSSQPLQTEVTVKSASERITVPAGTFKDCLLMEQVTSEGALPDDAPEQGCRLNRDSLCGVRQAWYAPGVGLVQLKVQGADGSEALLQLQEFSVQEGSDAHLPLATGNAWSYRPNPLPAGWTGREVYQITAQNDGRSFVQSYGYLRQP